MIDPLAALRRVVAAAVGLLLVALSLDGFRAAGSGTRRRILLDQAHHNLYAPASIGYRSFVALVTEGGFADTPNRSPFSAAALAATDILLIANPNGAGADAPEGDRARAAFTDAEVLAREL